MTPQERYLSLALGLARRGLGRVWPNPAVGCVIVAGARIVGRGWTQPGGRPHAEVMALAEAGAAARGATAFVTLEPCAHYGHTPPCADALIAAGIARVVAPLSDPDPRVSGAGFARLRAAGVVVETGGLTAEAAALNQGFLTRIRQGRPMLTLKLAQTIDGRIATAAGESRWITGAAARRLVHLMRAEHDGILIGAGTARTDDPMLDVRDIGLAAAAPVRIVADSRLSLSPGARLVRTAAQVPLWLAHGAAAPADRVAAMAAAGAVPLACDTGTDGRLDLAALMALLAGRGMTRLLCEGGGEIAAALLRAGLVDRLVSLTAPKAIGAEGLPGIGPLALDHLAAAPGFTLTTARRIGPDLLAVWERGATPC